MRRRSGADAPWSVLQHRPEGAPGRCRPGRRGGVDAPPPPLSDHAPSLAEDRHDLPRDSTAPAAPTDFIDPTEEREPTATELSAIEYEMPLIEAEMAVIGVEADIIGAGHGAS